MVVSISNFLTFSLKFFINLSNSSNENPDNSDNCDNETDNEERNRFRGGTSDRDHTKHVATNKGKKGDNVAANRAQNLGGDGSSGIFNISQDMIDFFNGGSSISDTWRVETRVKAFTNGVEREDDGVGGGGRDSNDDLSGHFSWF